MCNVFQLSLAIALAMPDLTEKKQDKEHSQV